MTQDKMDLTPGAWEQAEREDLSMVETSEWREWTTENSDSWLQEETKTAAERYRKGREEYGPTFVGDPLDHLRDEHRDSNFYAWQARRQRAALTSALIQARSQIQALERETRTLREAMAEAGIPAPPAGGGAAP